MISTGNLVSLLDEVREEGRLQGIREGRDQAAETKAGLDPLDKLVAPGDIVVRAVGNGYVITMLSLHEGVRATVHLVEGEIEEVGKQLIAINAAKVMQAANENSLPSGYGQITTTGTVTLAKLTGADTYAQARAKALKP